LSFVLTSLSTYPVDEEQPFLDKSPPSLEFQRGIHTLPFGEDSSDHGRPLSLWAAKADWTRSSDCDCPGGRSSV